MFKFPGICRWPGHFPVAGRLAGHSWLKFRFNAKLLVKDIGHRTSLVSTKPPMSVGASCAASTVMSSALALTDSAEALWPRTTKRGSFQVVTDMGALVP